MNKKKTATTESRKITRFGFAALFCLSISIGPVVAAAPARAAGEGSSELGTLTIRVENVTSRGGIVRLGLFNASHYPNDSQPTASADVPAQAGETIITLSNIPPGIYAIETFQDVNANGKMDMSWIGLPLEPFGFSRDARPRLHKPHFSTVSFPVTAGQNDQVLHLQNSAPATAAS